MNNSDYINPQYKSMLYASIITTALSIGAQFTKWEPVKIIGLTVLTGVGYGIINDMIACRECPEYFTVGHIENGKKLSDRLIRTLEPNQNAIAWGMFATWRVCAIAGIGLACLSRLPAPLTVKKVSASQLAPCLAIGAALTIIVAHVRSRATKNYSENDLDFYSNVSNKLRPRWAACDTRNTTGYLGIAVMGAIISIGVIASRTGLVDLVYKSKG